MFYNLREKLVFDEKNIRFYLERSEFVFYICGVLIN